ncbi:SRPBCC family protein [Streptomyces sp. NPDC059740]|uniref:SRPBCC family protein n=1 Tax=Streptomyces sp. NPDC059740 TaxID=3346926 RepID=UPI003662E117
MTEFERSRTLPALPELVFEQAANLDRIDSWLPHELHVREADPPAVTVHDDETGRDEAALLRARREQMRMEWGTREDGRYTGWLQVAGAGSGASEVTVHLSFLQGGHVPPREAVERALDESLARLAEEVRLRVDDAG